MIAKLNRREYFACIVDHVQAGISNRKYWSFGWSVQISKLAKPGI